MLIARNPSTWLNQGERAAWPVQWVFGALADQDDLHHRMTRQRAVQLVKLFPAGGGDGQGDAKVFPALARAADEGVIKDGSNCRVTWTRAATNPGAWFPMTLIGNAHGYFDERFLRGSEPG